MAGVGHCGDRVILLPLICCIYVLLYVQTCTQAQETYTKADNAFPPSNNTPTWDTSANGRHTLRDPSTNQSQQLSWVLDLCPSNTCRNQCGSHFSNCGDNACNCDKRCRLFQDCCPDFHETCPDESTEIFTQVYLRKHSYYMTYIKQHVSQVDGDIRKIQWIGTCPKWVDATTIQKCERPSTLSVFTYLQYAPVVYDGFIFRNKYCAKCHGIVDSYVLRSFSLSCSDERIKPDISNALGFEDLDKVFDIARQNCLIKYNITEFNGETARFLTYASSDSWKQCSLKAPTMSQELSHRDIGGLCESYQSMIQVGEQNMVFSNPHCALCNGITINEIMSHTTCGISACPALILTPLFWSLDILIDVASSENKELGEIISTNAGCAFGHIYDDLTDDCTPTVCNIGLVANGSTCFKAYEHVPYVFDRSEEEHTLMYVSRISQPLSLTELRNAIELTYEVNEIKDLEHDAHCSALPLNALSLLKTSLMDSTEYECVIIKVRFIKDFAIYRGLLQQLRSMFDGKGLPVQMFIFNYDIFQGTECVAGRDMQSQDAVLFGMPSPQSVLVRDVGYTWLTVQVPIMIYQGSDQDDIYKLSVKVCVKDWQPEDNDSQYNRAKMVMTVAGNVVSLLALFLTLVTFCILPSFKGIAHILLINLIIALFLSQSSMMAESFLDQNTVLCRAVGIFQHYSWLAYFFLMNTSALEMAWEFRSLEGMAMARQGQSNKGHLVSLLLYGWLSPLFLVTPSTILDFIDNDNLSPRYGRDGNCWLNNQKALLYFFIIPFSVIVSFNTILILLTVIKIKITTSHKHMLSQEQTFFQIILRLSMLMGLSWSLGLGASYTNIEALWYTFIVLNSLQGLILFFSSASPNRTVRRLSRRNTKSSRSAKGTRRSYSHGVATTGVFY